MANLTENPIYEAGIYQLETTDPVLGGPSGVSNQQAKQLANRTAWLKQRIDQFGNAIAEYTGNTNTLTESGWYWAGPGATGKPVDSSGWMNVIRYDAPAPGTDWFLQIFYPTLDDALNPVNKVFYRKISGTVGPWIELANKSDLDALNTQLVGQVAAFAANTPPSGWLKANGAAVNRTTYAALFARIGTTFGNGNGSTTFNLPDLRGEFIRGWADDRTVDTGRVFGSAQADELKSHFHLVKKFNRQVGTGAGFFALDDNGTDGSENTEATGGTETRPRNVALLYCIKF